MIRTLVGVLAFAVVACGVAGVGALSASADVGVGSWHTTGLLLGEPSGKMAVTLANGRVLVVHAQYEEATPAHPIPTDGLATELYEPVTGIWMPGPVLPGRNATTVVALADGGALLLGESKCTRFAFRCPPTSATYRLNASDSAWAPVAPMREPRARPAVVGLPDGRVLVAGGFGDDCTPSGPAGGNSCAPHASAEIFDPATGAWSPARPMPTPRGGGSATLLSDGTVLLVGGSKKTDGVLRFSPASGRWRTLGPSPSSLTGSQLLSLPGDRAIALGSNPDAGFFGSYGGAGKRAILICRSIPEIYDAATGVWTAAPPLPGEPISCSTNAVRLTNGQVLYSRGRDRYVLDTRQLCWSKTRVPVVRQHEGSLVALPAGRALDLGGVVADEHPSDGAEIYEPGHPRCVIAQQIQTSLFSRLIPEGRKAKIPSLLKKGYTLSLDTTRPGGLLLDWYYQPKETSEGKPGPVLVGVGRASSPDRGPVRLTLRLTRRGTRLLRSLTHGGWITLTAKGIFTPSGGRAVTATRAFTLTR